MNDVTFPSKFRNPLASKGSQLSSIKNLLLKLTNMKGNKELITVLNSLLADELIAINLYKDWSQKSGKGNFGLLTCNNNHLRVSHFIPLDFIHYSH